MANTAWQNIWKKVWEETPSVWDDSYGGYVKKIPDRKRGITTDPSGRRRSLWGGYKTNWSPAKADPKKYPQLKGTGLRYPRELPSGRGRWESDVPATSKHPDFPDSPMMREIILTNARGRAGIVKLIEVFGLDIVDRVLREDAGSRDPEFHHEDAAANLMVLDDLRRQRMAGSEPEMPAYQRRYSDWMR